MNSSITMRFCPFNIQIIAHKNTQSVCIHTSPAVSLSILHSIALERPPSHGENKVKKNLNGKKMYNMYQHQHITKSYNHLISLALTILLDENLFSFTWPEHVVKPNIVIKKMGQCHISIFYILNSWISFNMTIAGDEGKNNNNKHHNH